VFFKCRQQTNDQGRNIHDQVKYASISSEYVDECFFNIPSKKVQDKHIQDKMSEVSMNKTTGKKPPPLSLLSNRGRIKNKIVNDLWIAKAAN
jgi:hypothetical protein